MKTNRLAALLIAAAATVATSSMAQLFGTEQRLFPHGVASISNNPNIHATGANVYITWSTFSTGTNCSDIWLKASNNSGTSFGAAAQVSSCTAGQTNINPIVVGDGTNVHVFWTDEDAGENIGAANTGHGVIFYRKFTQAGSTVTPAIATQTIVNQVGYSRPTGALIDAASSARVHLVFYDNRAPSGSSVGKVFHKMSCNTGATWNAEFEVTQFDGGTDNEQPRIAQLSPSNQIVLTWRSSRGVPQGGWPPFQPMLLRMKNNTACPAGQPDWAYPAMRLSKGSDVDLGPKYAPLVVPGSADGLHALWWDDTAGTNLAHRYGKPNGAGFGAQQDLSQFGLNHLQWSEVGERLGYGLGEDATGQVHAIFQQNSSIRSPQGFQTGSVWYRCAPAPVGSAFVGKQLMGGTSLATQPRGVYANGRFHVVWADFRHTAVDQSEVYYNFVNTATACTAPPPGVAPTPSTTTVDFGGNSMQTTSLGTSLTLTNGGGSSLSIGTISATSGFAVSSTNCSTLAAGASCSITVTFTPPTTTHGATINGTLSVVYSGGANGTLNVNLTGIAEKSLVTHYYNSILNRAPDGAGKAFWDGEAARLSSLSVNINETWFVMAGYFFNSAEYLAAGKNDTQFVTDLYNTFFNRAPDGGGLGFWVGQIQGGLPREVVLFSFMFSPEFATFTQGIFGNTASRPEVDVVMDFFRGILNRLPDTSSFQYWLGRMRAAQCAGAGPVYTEVDAISAAFIFNPEYNNRGRNNTQFVTDMYYSFLRRGGDAGGVNFWINQLNTSQMNINTVRTNFLNSGEFGARVQAVINAGCYTGP